ncbi:hypothetical protein FCV25MIE_30810 [Fagus crenata]
MSRMGSAKAIVTKNPNERNSSLVQSGNNINVRTSASRVEPKHQGIVSKTSPVPYRQKSSGVQNVNHTNVRASPLASRVEPKLQGKVSKISSVPCRQESYGVQNVHNNNNVRASASRVEPKHQGNVSITSSVPQTEKLSGVHYSNHNIVRNSHVKAENQGNVSKVSSVPDKQKQITSEVQKHDEKNAVKTSRAELPSDSPTARARRRIQDYIQTDKTGCTPQFQSTQKRNDFMPPVTNRQSKSTGQKKFERQPFERPSKVQPSKKQPEVKMQPPKMPSKECSNQYVPTYHIEWDGFDDPTTEPFGQNCPLCGNDLAYLATDDELDPSMFPEVAVLSCGHSFHCQCLLLLSEEQSTDPQCFVCVNGLS